MRRLRIIAVAVLTMISLILGTLGAAPAASAADASAPDVPVLRKIRALHHKGYDRLVFKFEGPLPELTQVRWVDKVYRGESASPHGCPATPS